MSADQGGIGWSEISTDSDLMMNVWQEAFRASDVCLKINSVQHIYRKIITIQNLFTFNMCKCVFMCVLIIVCVHV